MEGRGGKQKSGKRPLLDKIGLLGYYHFILQKCAEKEGAERLLTREPGVGETRTKVLRVVAFEQAG